MADLNSAQNGPTEAPITVSMWPVFRPNFRYVLSLWGSLNACQLGLSVICLVVFAPYCHLTDGGYASYGFIGEHQDTTFYLVNCISIVMSFLMFSCCTLSMKTTDIFLKIIYAPASHLICSLLYFSSSVALLQNIASGYLPLMNPETAFKGTVVVGVLGLVNSCLYGASFLMFCCKRK